MEIQLREALLIYAGRFPEGHPLRDIALTTLHELGKENPFGRNKPHTMVNKIEVSSLRHSRKYDSLVEACEAVNKPIAIVRFEIQQVLKKYNLKLV